MKKFMPLLLIILGVQIPFDFFGQDYNDLLRFSQDNFQGSARSYGMGSAVGSMGGDYGSIAINPAGLGIYRTSEFFGSLGLGRPKSESNYYGQASSDDKYNFNIPNVGLVVSTLRYKDYKPKRDGWVAVNFSFGFSRTNTYSNKSSLEAIQNKTSIIDNWRENANGTDPNNFDPKTNFSNGSLAYNTYLLEVADTTKTDFQYKGANQAEKIGYKKYQRDLVNKSGNTSEIQITLAGNHSNKFFFGGSLLIPIVSYTYSRTFYEENQDEVKYYKNTTLQEDVSTDGAGFSANFGFIYKPIDAIRFGASYRLPTIYYLNDNFSSSISASLLQSSYDRQVSSPDGTYSYQVVTPGKLTLSATAVLDKIALFSIDYQYIGYTDARINESGEAARIQNKNVTYYLQNASNIRVGGELNVTSTFALRAGFQYFASPYKSDFVPTNADGSMLGYTFGGGYRDKTFFLDFGYQILKKSEYYIPYTLKTVPIGVTDIGSINKYSTGNAMITIGTKF